MLNSLKKEQKNFVMFDIANEIADIYNNANIKLPDTCLIKPLFPISKTCWKGPVRAWLSVLTHTHVHIVFTGSPRRNRPEHCWV